MSNDEESKTTKETRLSDIITFLLFGFPWSKDAWNKEIKWWRILIPIGIVAAIGAFMLSTV